MYRIIIMVIVLIGISETAKADTIDYWFVHYNKICIKSFNQNTVNNVILKQKDIKSDDTLTVFYFRDTPHPNCMNYLSIENKTSTLAFKGGEGTFSPIKIPLAQLIPNTKKNVYNIFYFENQIDDGYAQSSPKILLFTLKIE